MTSTLVVACRRCAGLLLAKADQKTRTCPYCGHLIIVSKAKQVASAENAFKASEILRELKARAMSHNKTIPRLQR